MSMLSSWMHPERGYQAAEEQLQNYYNQAQGYQQPYSEAGQEAYGQLSPAIQALLDPQGLQSQWMEGYQESPQAQYDTQHAMNVGQDLASSMGLTGSSTALRGIEGKAGEIAAADRQQYLNDLMQKYMLGTGLAQNVFNTGAMTAGQMGNRASQTGSQMAEMEFGRTNSPGNLLNNLLNSVGTLGGTVLGGPIGGAIAKKYF